MATTKAYELGQLGGSLDVDSANNVTLTGDGTIGTDTGGIFNIKGGSTTSPQVRFFDGGTARARIGVPTGQTYLSLSGSDTLTADAVITAAGNVLVGTTDNTVYNNSGSGTGINLQNFGNIAVARDGNDCMVLNRLNSDGAIALFNKDGTTVGSIGTQGGDLWVGTGNTGAYFWDGSNTIAPWNTSTNTTRDAGIDLGTSSVRWKDLYLSNSVKVITATNGTSIIDLGDTADNDIGRIAYDNSVNAMYFKTNNSEAMRIDSSGNLLVGTTDSTLHTNTTGGGFKAGGDNRVDMARQADTVAVMNRTGNSDGTILQFRKDGSTVGSIACRSSGGNLQIHTNYSGIDFAGDGYLPMRGSSITDNSLDIGSSSFRYQDIYATNGTIQTSDANEKQQIASLTDAEITAAKAISKLFKTFKWNNSVAEKGDAARTHTGVIAQEVEQAMTDAGLNAGDYAFFISSDWTDEETGEERNRKGIRYPQLMSFIGAATEQRLASIEARLDALEGN